MAGPDIQTLDPQVVLQAMQNKERGPLTRQTERVGYWKRPLKMQDGRPIAMPGWIIWGDTQPGKRDDYIYRGFYPLPQFGRVGENAGGRDGELFRQYGGWGAILSHPAGPSAFPVEQVVTFR
jgi:hypothetical protein